MPGTPVTGLDLVRAVIAVASVIVFCLVGLAVGRRKVSPEGRLANGMFQIWWYGLGSLTLITPLGLILKLLRLDTFDVYLFLIQALLLLLFVAVAGLVYYLVYLYTGQRWWLAPIMIFYGLMQAWLGWIFVKMHPYGYGIPPPGTACPNTSTTTPAFLDAHGNPVCGDQTIGLVFSGALLIPVILAAVFYFLLLFRTPEPISRYRIAVVSSAIGLWFTSSLVASIAGLNRYDLWSIVSALISLSAAVAVLMAYRPPSWVRSRLGAEATAG